MSEVKASVNFRNDFSGAIVTDFGSFKIGEGGLFPYDMLQGALASCLHATFLSIIAKKHLTIEAARYEIAGVKRETPPTTLSEVHLKVNIKSADDQEQLTKSFALATKYCSVYATVSAVAKIDYTLSFGD